jgi:hypothetical protein
MTRSALKVLVCLLFPSQVIELGGSLKFTASRNFERLLTSGQGCIPRGLSAVTCQPIPVIAKGRSLLQWPAILMCP